MIAARPYVWADDFQRAQALTTTPGFNGWTVADTSSSGTPTYLCVSDPNGAMKLTLANTNEAEIVTMYHNDVLGFDFEGVDSFEIVAKVASIDAVTTLTMGLGTARHDTDDTVAGSVWFRMEGSASTSNLVVETDDGTTDNDDKPTGQTLSSTYKRLFCDCSVKTDVKFFIGDTQGGLVRVATGTTFDMSGLTGNVQPLIQLQKASGTGVPSVTIDYFCIRGTNYGT